jgi:hypothetical protein
MLLLNFQNLFGQNIPSQSNTTVANSTAELKNTQNTSKSKDEIRDEVPTLSQQHAECIDGHIQRAVTSGNQPGFGGENVLDQDMKTRWSNNGIGSWIQVDLGSGNKICDIKIAWYKGTERQNNFIISNSTDGIKFTNIFSGKSSGTTLNFEKYNMTDVNGRFIRITVNGNTQNSYAGINEISVDLVSTRKFSTFSIAAAGDWGSGRNDNWKKTVQLMIDNKVNLALGLGDYSYGSMSDFQPVVNELKKAGIPMKGAKGDHDSDSYAKIFEQPSMVYAFDAGSARIILLDSYKSARSNAEFLEKELIATRAPWKIVIVTTPLYTSPSKHEPDKELATALKPLLDKYDVDLVMWGDNHNYERTVFPNMDTIFVQSGTGGESHYKFDGQTKESIYQNDEDFGITKLTVNNQSILGQFISHSGKILDTFNLLK